MQAQENDNNVEMWKMRKLIEYLRTAKGKQGGSMISYIIPGGKAIANFTTQLESEKGRASNIKDRINK